MPTSNMIGIIGSGAYLPKQEIEVKELAHKYHLNYHDIIKDHGIRRVHLANSSESEVFMATRAVEDALDDSRLPPQNIDLVIYCKGISKQKTARPISSQIIEKIKASEEYG